MGLMIDIFLSFWTFIVFQQSQKLPACLAVALIKA